MDGQNELSGAVLDQVVGERRKRLETNASMTERGWNEVDSMVGG